jgi:hypothetical protein
MVEKVAKSRKYFSLRSTDRTLISQRLDADVRVSSVLVLRHAKGRERGLRTGRCLVSNRRVRSLLPRHERNRSNSDGTLFIIRSKLTWREGEVTSADRTRPVIKKLLWTLTRVDRTLGDRCQVVSFCESDHDLTAKHYSS